MRRRRLRRLTQGVPMIDQLYKCLVYDTIYAQDPVPGRNGLMYMFDSQKVEFDTTPLVSIRKTAWRCALQEMEWFLSGSVDINQLPPGPKKWWVPWANEEGHVPNSYGWQFRFAHGVNQIGTVIEQIKEEPYSRRHVITTWDPSTMFDEETPLANCHGTVIQFFVTAEGTLNMTMYQRSGDLVCGVPHNWIQYWAFLMYVAHRTKKKVGWFTWMGGAVHVYEEHLELAQKICRTDLPRATPELLYVPSSTEFLAKDFALDGPYEPILCEKAEVII